MNNAINIGAPTMAEAAEPLAKAIVSIMSADVEQKTIRAALATFGRCIKVDNVVINGAHVDARTINLGDENA